MKKIKILHIFHELKFSGAEIMYADAATVFKKLGCELTAVSTAENIGEFAPILEKNGYKIVHKTYPKLKNYLARIEYYFLFVKFLKKEKFDVVHIHRNDAMWGMSLCAWLANKRVIYTFHNVFSARKITYWYHYLLRWSAKNIFHCEFQTISDSVYENELHYFHNPTTKIYNWYGSNRFYPALSNEKEKFREELKISLQTLVLISVGGCSPIKRHTDIIKALPIIFKEQTDVLYLHLGEGISESDEINLAKELGVEKNIRFCKNQIDVRKYLIASDIYVMPSKHEGIPITTIETMACEIPAILYNVPGLCDFNKSGINSLLIPEYFEVLAEKVLYLNSNPNEGIKLATNAKKFVDSNFNMENNATKIVELYIKKV